MGYLINTLSSFVAQSHRRMQAKGRFALSQHLNRNGQHQ